MALSSRPPVRASVTTGVAVLISLGFLASCGDNQSLSSPTTTTQSTSSSPTMPTELTSSSPTATSQSSNESSEVRLGCGTFCQNAGGYGGAGDKPTQFAVTVDSSQTVTVDPDGYVPVTVTCNLPVQCNGVLMVDLMSQGYNPLGGGRSDLVVDAGATRTIGVPLESSVFDYLRSHGPTLGR